jgi:hypothetical protein
MGVITIFEESSFIFSFVGYGLVAWGWVHIWEGWGENKMSKDESEFFPTKLGWIISPSF